MINEDNESDEEKSDIEMKEDNHNINITNKINDEYSLLDQLSTTKYNYDSSDSKPIIFYNYVPQNENFQIGKTAYFDLIAKTEKKIKSKTLKNIKNFLNLEKNPLNILPNENNRDLKRMIAPRLRLLKEKTENAILDIIKENIKLNNKENLSKFADLQFQKDLKEVNVENEE